jgi:hypothetical protein
MMPPPMPRKAGDEADDDAVGDTATDGHLVCEGLPRPVDQLPSNEMTLGRPPSTRFTAEQPDRQREQDGGHDQIKGGAGDAADDERAGDRAGQRGGGEGEATAIVDPTLTRVGGRAGGGVEEDRGQADRGQRRRPFVRIEQQQDRGEDEAAARADDRAERTDGEAEQREQDGGCRREAQR